jgi:hypothetical protein
VKVNAQCPSEYSGAPLAPWSCHQGAVPYRIGCSLRVSPTAVVLYGVQHSRFAVGRISPALRSSRRWTRLKTVRFSAHPLCEFRLRLGLCPVPPSSRQRLRRRSSSSRGLCLPFSTCSQDGPLIAGLCLPAPFHPQGLVTLSVVYSHPGLAGFVSRRQRSWEVPFGAFPSQEVLARFRTSELTYRFIQRFLRHHKGAGPVRWIAVSELSPSREFLAIGGVFSTPNAGCSHGFSPFEGSPATPFPRISPGILSRAWPTRPASRRLHLRVSIGCRLVQSAEDRSQPRTKQPL